MPDVKGFQTAPDNLKDEAKTYPIFNETSGSNVTT